MTFYLFWGKLYVVTDSRSVRRDINAAEMAEVAGLRECSELKQTSMTFYLFWGKLYVVPDSRSVRRDIETAGMAKVACLRERSYRVSTCVLMTMNSPLITVLVLVLGV